MAKESHIDMAAESSPAPPEQPTQRFLTDLEALNLPADLLDNLIQRLPTLLAVFPDGDRILANLSRFLTAARSPQSWLAQFEREPEVFDTLLKLFSTSQYVADRLTNDPEAFELVRMTEGKPVDPKILKDEIVAEVLKASDSRSASHLLRDYRHRETLRIAYGDFINRQSIDTVTSQISILAECIIEAAVAFAHRDLSSRQNPPLHADRSAVGFCVLALGKLGGRELNYSSDVDLVLIREDIAPPPSWQKPDQDAVTADEYFQRLGQLVIKLLGETTSRGTAYRVDMRLRPHGRSGPLVASYRAAVSYFDSAGRTWERQAFLKARPVAGDSELGHRLLDELQPWIYRRYLMQADITGLIALKRRIEHRSQDAGETDRDIKFGRGGIRDIEYAIQFLQLLHGGELPEVRSTETLDAIDRLTAAGCLTALEQSMLSENYRFLRSIEHRLQIMYDRQTHLLPEDAQALDEFAAKMEGQPSSDSADSDSNSFSKKLSECTRQNRQILDHLLHNAFSHYEYGSEQQIALPECDLILDPEPSPEVIQVTLEPYGFSDCSAAYRRLQEMASEAIPFLSTRRSRHFLAAIAPKLLSSIAATPNPDATLISLANVSDSLGGKAVLWELFSANPPSMQLCIRLCATSPYLTSILTSNPGMIDELLDSLMLAHLPTFEELSTSLEELCRGAVETAPILHSFKNSMHLRVGVRDILGKNSIDETHAALSDIAEVCMDQVIHGEFHRLIHRLGVPMTTDSKGTRVASEFVVLAVGKIGGREPNYHSDIDLLFLFDGDGNTKSLLPSRRFEPTTNRHFFNELSQRVVNAVTRHGSTGRLYDLDVRLRPMGRSGQLAITIDDLNQYFENGSGQVWERQALCKARPIWGSEKKRSLAMKCIRHILLDFEWTDAFAEEIYANRLQLEQDAGPANLKRGVGGTMDIEFIVQLLQLAHANEHPEILVPGTLDAIAILQSTKLLDSAMAKSLYEHYQFLRSIESGIRLMNLSARHEMPSDPTELDRLAFLLSGEDETRLEHAELVLSCDQARSETRAMFERVFAHWRPPQVD